MDVKQLTQWLSGRKTYTVAAVMAIAAGALWMYGAADAKEALVGVLVAAGMATLRDAIAKLPTEQLAKLERFAALYRSITQSVTINPPPGHAVNAVSVDGVSSLTITPPTPPLPTEKTTPPASVPALLLALSVATSAAAGEVAITGPTAVPIAGFPCTLHLEGEMAAGTVIGWTVTPRNDEIKQISPAANGISAQLTTVAGTWNVCAAIHEPDRPIYFRFYKVHVPGAPYVPPPGPAPAPSPPPSPPVPTPPPAPVPPMPPGPPSPGPVPVPEPLPNRFGLRSKAAEVVRLISSTTKATEAKCLAEGLKEIETRIRDGTLSGGQAIVNAIGAALDRCTSSAWDTPREGLSAFIDALIRSGQLASNDDWRQAVQEAEAGLRDAI